MSWCPQCRTEYVEGVTVCPDCSVALVAALPVEDHSPEEMVIVHTATDQPTADIIVATLEAEGIDAVIQQNPRGPAAGMLPNLGIDMVWNIAVPAEQADTARVILSASPPTEEELAAEEAADPTTLEEAEESVQYPELELPGERQG